MTLSDLVQEMARAHCDSITFRFDAYAHSMPVSNLLFNGQSRIVYVDAAYGNQMVCTRFSLLDAAMDHSLPDKEVGSVLRGVREKHDRALEPKGAE